MQGEHHQSTRQTQAGADAGRRGCLFAALLIADVVLFLLAFWVVTGGNPRALSALALVAGVAAIVFSVPAALLIMQDELGIRDILRGLGCSRGWQVMIGGLMVILLAGLAVAALAGLWSPPESPAPTPAPPYASLTVVVPASPTARPPAVSASPTAPPPSAPPTAPALATLTTLPTPPASAVPPTLTPLPTETSVPPTPVPPSPAPPTATPSPSPQPLATATAVPRTEELVAAAVLEANEALVGAMLNLAHPGDELRAYYCGTSAWRKMTVFLTKVAQTRGGAVTATYFFSDSQPPVQELDYRWRLEQAETWTYVGRTGKSSREELHYTYWLVERPGETPALCIDDYTSKRVP